ncbi:hypothetical protein [Halovulum sp. GXIMD14793]
MISEEADAAIDRVKARLEAGVTPGREVSAADTRLVLSASVRLRDALVTVTEQALRLANEHERLVAELEAKRAAEDEAMRLHR